MRLTRLLAAVNGKIGFEKKLLSGNAAYMVFWDMINGQKVLLLSLLALIGCAPANVSPGMTFWVGLRSYQDEMENLAGRPERWPERQRMAGSLKATYTFTFGGSQEFNRLVDLDLRRKEFLISLRKTEVRPDRAKEMTDELATIDKDVDGLKEIVKGQVAGTVLRGEDQNQRIETIATIGLVNLALDGFSGSNPGVGFTAPATKVGPNLVTDLGSMLSTVTLHNGQIYRCSTILVPEAGAGIKCDPPSAK